MIEIQCLHFVFCSTTSLALQHLLFGIIVSLCTNLMCKLNIKTTRPREQNGHSVCMIGETM